jgi:hypothetical protein
MHIITLAGSEHQKSRLRNGHKVRVKHGKGFNVIVSPNTYHLVSRSFNKNKGATLQLTPEEIAMNKAPSPEIQAQIMGHNDHLILPTGPGGELIRGSGIGDWFKNVGNQIKSGFENKIIRPVQEHIVNPVKNVYEQNVPENIRRDINTVGRFSSVPTMALDFGKRIAKGEKAGDIMKNYFEDLKHLNNTKNKIIKSSPVLTEAYKNGVMATAGLGSAALGSAFGLSPATGALAGAAGSMGARELLKAEGYGLHHAIEHGERHHYDELKHHCRPIGGALGFHHIKNFFKHAGHAIQKAMPVVKQGANMAHNFLLNNPELAKKVKEHGSKLAGMLAKMGVNYLSGNEKYGDQAEQMGSKLADEQIHQKLGYGIGDDIGHAYKRGFEKFILGKGIHDAIEHGERHHYDELKHHCRPIGGALKMSHITNFFKHAGHAVKNAFQQAVPVVKQGANMAHNFLLNNPELAKKVKEHGSKLAGMLAKMGVNYLSGNEKYGDQAEQMGSKLADEQIHKNLGYGLYSGVSGGGLGTGLYAGKMRGTGQFHSFSTLKNASDAYSNANAELARMSDLIVHNQHTQKPIQKYYDGDLQPRSRGSGIHPHASNHIHQDDHLHQRDNSKDNHYNLVRGKNTLIEHKTHLPPALVSQPYGANFHMQFQLPPQYQKYNDGTYTY